jgi:hypothetical protein
MSRKKETCQHESVHCLNEYDIIRKYRCAVCGEVMICACDKEFGEKHLPHQLNDARDSLAKRVPVTLGFQNAICRECRGLPAEAHPVAEMHGRTSKIKRYYWRELLMRELEIYGQWASENGANPLLPVGDESVAARKRAEKQALSEIKKQHEELPKYSYQAELSQDEVLRSCGVDVVSIEADYATGSDQTRVCIVSDTGNSSIEEYAASVFERQGYECIFVESVPFHVLFGVYLWLIVQDPEDSNVRVSAFGNRGEYESGEAVSNVLCLLPDDFGTAAYSERRRVAIDEHFNEVLNSDDAMWLFDYWLEHSWSLRQYLWAHRDSDIETARKLIQILPFEVVRRVLRYLIDSYWERYLGWPDLLVHKEGEYFFAEVKSANDKLSANQKCWMLGNRDFLQLPVKMVKVLRRRTDVRR